MTDADVRRPAGEALRADADGRSGPARLALLALVFAAGVALLAARLRREAPSIRPPF